MNNYNKPYGRNDRAGSNNTSNYRSNSGNGQDRGYSRGGNNGGGNRGGRGQSNFYGAPQKRGKFQGQYIDPTRLVKKATFTEKVEYLPVNNFADFKINGQLKENIIKKGYVKPTPIQDITIPMILDGKNVLGIANTGTGKTGAFLIPLISKTLNDRNQKVLIIVPTRELAAQIKEELMSFTERMTIKMVLCIGGSDIRRQMNNLRQQHNFVVATPGRLKDLVMRNVIRLHDFQNIVLDEVDRMLDMGFLPEIKFLVEKMPDQKQSLFFSATLDPKIEAIANTFLLNHEKVSVKTQETSENIDQDIIVVESPDRKINQLHELLIQQDFIRVLIFSKTKRGAEKINENLLKRGHKVDAIHGDKSQSKRQQALDSFKSGRIKVLIATDVVARGIDVADISHVINYDMPNTYEDYVHRIGRTGRGNKAGKALTFIDR